MKVHMQHQLKADKPITKQQIQSIFIHNSTLTKKIIMKQKQLFTEVN